MKQLLFLLSIISLFSSCTSDESISKGDFPKKYNYNSSKESLLLYTNGELSTPTDADLTEFESLQHEDLYELKTIELINENTIELTFLNDEYEIFTSNYTESENYIYTIPDNTTELFGKIEEDTLIAKEYSVLSITTSNSSSGSSYGRDHITKEQFNQEISFENTKSIHKYENISDVPQNVKLYIYSKTHYYSK